MSQRQTREWSREEVIKLIGFYECNPCLWDNRHAEYKNRIKKNSVLNNIAQEFSTTENEVSRKLHNLRSQWQNELKKTKKKKSGSGQDDLYKSSWSYFDDLRFLDIGSAPSTDALDNSAACSNDISSESQQSSIAQDKENIELTRPNRAAKKRKDDDILRKCNQILSEPNDDDQIFGEYVSSILRSFSSAANKKLRRIIQRAIVDIQDEEDETTSSRGSSSQSVYLNLPVYSPASTVSSEHDINLLISDNERLLTNTAEHTGSTDALNNFKQTYDLTSL